MSIAFGPAKRTMYGTVVAIRRGGALVGRISRATGAAPWAIGCAANGNSGEAWLGEMPPFRTLREAKRAILRVDRWRRGRGTP